MVCIANSRWNMRAYCSPTYFCSAYGFSGFGVIVSTSGIFACSPYTDDDPEYTTRRTFRSRAAISTFSVPTTLVMCVSTGFAIESGIRGSAATWNTVSTPSNASPIDDASRISPSISSAARFTYSRRAGREVVDHPHAQSRRDERIHQMRSDKSRAARHEHKTSLQIANCWSSRRSACTIGQNCVLCIARIT